MSNSIIEVKNISKKYNINHQQGGYVALRDVVTNIFKNPLSFLKTKTKEVLGIEKKEIFWALKGVNFEVMKGEVIGIIGRNGAGKSTLLKILSQITPPTRGEIRINGTVGSLLEVGTGFHPELTGRENIFLNGAILGIKRKDIIRKFNEIVKFASIEKFLDTPVKYYSSGMYVRLAFSVAAHMDTDILIIDEVLAVGDAEFQKKCLGKMNEITKKEGRTILFVSHNMTAIQSLCTKVILFNNGTIKKIGTSRDIIKDYLSLGVNNKEKLPIDKYRIDNISNVPIYIDNIYTKGHQNEIPVINMKETPTIIINIVVNKRIEKANITISLLNSEGIKTDMAFSWDDNFYLNVEEGHHQIEFTPQNFSLPPGRYSVSVGLNQSDNTVAWDGISCYPIFEIENHGDVTHWGSRPWAIHHSQNNTWLIHNI